MDAPPSCLIGEVPRCIAKLGAPHVALLPCQKHRVLVVGLVTGRNMYPQGIDTGKAGPLEGFASEDAKSDLDLIEPTG